MHGTCKNTETLDLWTEQLAFAAASIVLARVRFIRLFGELFSSVYALLLKNEQPHLRYHCSLGKVDHEPSVNDLTYNFIDRYKENIPYEIQRGQTLAGPHRDEILLSINGREIKKYSSQGQQRSFLIGMKLSLHQYLHEQNGEKPISLLDDLFSELDTKRTGDILDILTTYGQVLITSTEMKKAAGVTAISVEDLKKKAEENHVEG
jgi:DNA replication and repair protein RecF